MDGKKRFFIYDLRFWIADLRFDLPMYYVTNLPIYDFKRSNGIICEKSIDTEGLQALYVFGGVNRPSVNATFAAVG
jgi:hypothetical protein